MGGLGGLGGSELGVASSLRALSIILLCTNQECRGEAGGGFRGKEQSFSLLLRHLKDDGNKNVSFICSDQTCF